MEKEKRYNNVDLSSRQKGGDNCINPLAKDEQPKLLRAQLSQIAMDHYLADELVKLSALHRH
jgi:hypothetical protein